jgi:drug/metabolite transporter (DMT)-like permease
LMFGLLSALSYGYADFVGAIAAKRVRALAVTTVSFGVGLVVAIFASLFLGASYELTTIQIGVLAGVCSAAAISFLYAALALGPISIVSPLTAVLSALLPVIVDLLTGATLSSLAGLAIVLILVAVVLVAFVPGADVRLPSLRATLYSVGAGVGFSGIFIFLDLAPSDSGLGVLVVMRLVGIAILFTGLVMLYLSRRSSVIVERELFAKSTLWLVVLAGFGDVSGNVFFLVATREGSLAVAAVLTALYPIGTILLARIFLKERIALSQNLGIALAITACALLALS